MLDLEPIKAREAAATEGPWEIAYVGGGRARTVMIRGANGGLIVELHPDDIDDGVFIHGARQDVPSLIAEVERLREENRHSRAD